MMERGEEQQASQSCSPEGAELMAYEAVDSLAPPSASPARSPQQVVFLAAGLVVLAAVAAFSNSFTGPFVFDDLEAITDNPTIRQLWPIWKPLCPPSGGETVSDRPVLNLSLAINYAVSGCDVRGYHVTNLAIHLLAALLLFGVLRRTLLLPLLADRWAPAATPLALAIALLWAVHPLQTESVTYIVQRAESLMGLFYLLTLYCSLRGAGSDEGDLLVCRVGAGLPVGHGDQGGDGLRPVDRAPV